MKLKRQVKFQTPAKINFFLYIQGKRSDGYHELFLDLIPVSLFDSIEITPSRTGGIELESNLDDVSLENNLVVKAVRLLENETNEAFSLKIKHHKTIPTGAGLGGGSGNAAGTLVVLNQLFDLKFSEGQIRKMALSLGADVPFFVHPRPSIAEGIGEILSPLPSFPSLHLLLIFPGFSISTKEAYASCTISARKEQITGYSLQRLTVLKPEMNDFWRPLVEEYPELEQARTSLKRQNAIYSGLSGSGSTVFGVFKDRDSRDSAFSSLSDRSDWSLFRCQTLEEHQYVKQI